MKAIVLTHPRRSPSRTAWLATLSLCLLPLAGPGLGAQAPAGPGTTTAPAATAAPVPAKSLQRGRGLEDIVLESDGLTLTVKPSTQEIEVKRLDVTLLRYVMAPTNFKPYVKEFRTLRGDNLLLDSPPDHVHHHALMYAITVNGTNFWEEQTNPGVQLPSPVPMRYVGKLPDGRPLAVFSHMSLWLAHTNRMAKDPVSLALLTEQRTLMLAVDEAAGEVALRWQSDFTVGKAANEVVLTGAAYHGLGLRFVHDFDLKGRHLNSAGAPYSAEQKWDVIPARWAATLGRIGDRDVMAAIFASPKNAGESRFFSMLNGFAYLSATQNLDQAPLTYKQGERFGLEYLILNRDGHLDATALEARQQAWLKELAAPARK